MPREAIANSHTLILYYIEGEAGVNSGAIISKAFSLNQFSLFNPVLERKKSKNLFHKRGVLRQVRLWPITVVMGKETMDSTALVGCYEIVIKVSLMHTFTAKLSLLEFNRRPAHCQKSLCVLPSHPFWWKE